MQQLTTSAPTELADDPPHGGDRCDDTDGCSANGTGTNAAARRASAAAAHLGVAPAQVETLPFDLSVLEEDGIFVNVDARGFGLLDRRLDWEACGVTLPRGAKLAFRPPRCGLLPDRHRLPLLRPASQAHAALGRYSFRFRLTETLFETPAYRWVPWRAFEAFEREFRAAEGALAAAKAALLAEYDAVREEVLATFLQLARDSVRRLEATGHLVPEGFAEAVTDRVRTSFPTPGDIRDRLTLRYRPGVILLGSEMVEEQRRTRAARRALEEAEAEERLAQRQREARERLVQQELWADQERVRRRLAAEDEERRREAVVKERLREIKLEAARERLKDELSPLEEGWQQLHAQVYAAVVAIRDSLQRHGARRGASARRARELGRWVKLMNWQDDRQLAALVGELERLASRPTGGRKRDPGPIADVLGDIIELTHVGARAITEPHRLDALEL